MISGASANFVILSLLLCVVVDAKAVKMEMGRRNYNNVLSSDKIVEHNPIGYERTTTVKTYLYGAINTTFEYFTAIELGKTKQMFTVQVDTGSSVLAVPATGCEQYDKQTYQPLHLECNHTDPFYDMESPNYVSCSSYDCQYCQDSNCVTALGYGDGSFLRGPMINDLLTIADVSTSINFGAILFESYGFARTGVDGIMGIAYTGLDAGAGQSAIDQLVNNHQIENSFSMCLGYTGGFFTLGGVDDSLSAGPMTYTPIVEQSYYVIEMTDFLVGGKSVQLNSDELNGNHTIVDSGTTLLVLNTPLFNTVVNLIYENYCPSFPPELQTLCSPDAEGYSIFTPGACWGITESDVNFFPTLSVQLKNASVLPITPQAYFLQILESGSSSPFFCFGLAPGPDGLGTILGDVFMQNYNIFFDRANAQIGFAPVQNCTGATALMSVYGGDKQSGNIGKPLSIPLQVQVLYTTNQMAAIGLIVEFSVPSGAATFSDPRVAVDLNGIAQTSITISSRGPVTVTATLYNTDTTVTFTVTGTGLAGWEIAIVVIVSVLIVVAVIVAVILIRRRRRNARLIEEQQMGLLEGAE